MSVERVKKKIVIRGIPSSARKIRDSSGRPEPDRVRTQEQQVLDQLPEKDPDFQGEIFEQFYSPLGRKENQGRLENVAAEPLEVVMPDYRLSPDEKSLLEKQRQRAAEALSRQIYHLAQTKRETGLDFYLSALEVVLGPESCEEAKEILNRANSWFTSEYDSLIKERGERPDIYHQIVKRVGHNMDRIRRVVTGLDIRDTGKILWQISREDIAEKQRRLRAVLEDCTEKEVRALRREFTRIPARELCEILHETLKAPVDAKQISTESADYWQKVRQAQAEAAARVRETLKYDYERLCYVLRGRSRDDVALITAQYDLDYAADKLEINGFLREQIKDRLGDLSKEPLALLDGFDPIKSAQAIDELIQSRDLDDILEGRMNSSIFDVEEEIKLNNLFLHRFYKRRVYRQRRIRMDNWIDAREGLLAQVEYLTNDQFNVVNGLLSDNFGYQLNRSDYPILADFDPRSRALALSETLQTRSRLRNILQPLAYLNPLQCAEVKVAYLCITGHPLKEAVENRIREIYGDAVPEGIAKLVNNRIEGRLRWPLRIDLMQRFRGDSLYRNGSLGAWDLDEVATTDTEQGALTIAEIINDDRMTAEEKGYAIVDFVRAKTYQELNAIEYAFYELSDPSEPLLITLKEFVEPVLHSQIAMLFAGVDVEDQVVRMQEDLAVLYELRNQPTDAIRLTRILFQRSTGMDLIQAVKDTLQESESEDTIIDILSILYAPEASDFFSCLIQLGDETEAVLERMRPFWSRPVVDALAFEKACDYRFGRLRLVLKNVTMAGIIPKKLFVEAMMYLEGIAPDVPANIMNAIKFNDIDHLMHLLDMHREDQVSLEEALDLLLPEPLRRTLMRMEVPLDLIHEAILHLDSYYPHDLAQDLQKILETKSGQELSDYVVDFFRESTPENPNPRIPEDINWSGEMAYQIRLAYNLAFKTELFNVLRSKGLSNEVLAHLASRIFGNEPTKVALDLYQLMRNTMDASAWPKVIETISIRGMRSRERVMEVYGAFFQPQAPKTALLDDIARVLKAEDKQTRLMELFRPPAQAPAEGEEASA